MKYSANKFKKEIISIVEEKIKLENQEFIKRIAKFPYKVPLKSIKNSEAVWFSIGEVLEKDKKFSKKFGLPSENVENLYNQWLRITKSKPAKYNYALNEFYDLAESIIGRDAEDKLEDIPSNPEFYEVEHWFDAVSSYAKEAKEAGLNAPGAKVKRGDNIIINSNSFKYYKLVKGGFKGYPWQVKGLKGYFGKKGKGGQIKGKITCLGSVKTPEGILYHVSFIPGYGKDYWVPEKAVKKYVEKVKRK